VVRETPAAAAQIEGASKTLRALLFNFTSTPFLRTCVCKNILELELKILD
jgi:hypothetical protein